eukprot:1339340-Rhodomonas_salina.1
MVVPGGAEVCVVEKGALGRASRVVSSLHPEIMDKKPHFQYNSYQECGFLCLISHWICLPDSCALPGTDTLYQDASAEQRLWAYFCTRERWLVLDFAAPGLTSG